MENTKLKSLMGIDLSLMKKVSYNLLNALNYAYQLEEDKFFNLLEHAKKGSVGIVYSATDLEDLFQICHKTYMQQLATVDNMHGNLTTEYSLMLDVISSLRSSLRN